MLSRREYVVQADTDQESDQDQCKLYGGVAGTTPYANQDIGEAHREGCRGVTGTTAGADRERDAHYPEGCMGVAGVTAETTVK